jgi:uncharacterized protein (TIRG00374 family)
MPAPEGRTAGDAGVVNAPLTSARGRRVARSLGFQVFASESHAPRARRAVDAATVVVGAVLIAGLAVVAEDRATLEQSWQELAEALPGWVQWLAEVTYFVAGSYLVVLVIGVGLVARRRKDLLRDLLVGAALSIGLAVVLARVVSGGWPDVVFLEPSSTATTYPALFITLLTAVHVTAAPHLSRPVRRLGWWIVVAVVAAALLANLTQVRDSVAAVIAGVTIGALVHLVFGSPAGRPSRGRVASALTELGVSANDLTFEPDQDGTATGLTAIGAGGEPLHVLVYGRDAARSQRIARAWRVAWYRDPPDPSGSSRLQLVEHAALALLLAGRGGVRVPQVVAVGSAGAGDVVLVTSAPGRPLADLDEAGLDDAVLADAWAQLQALHDAGVAHGQPNLGHLYLDDAGRVGISGFDVAQVSPADATLLSDCAELLTATTLAVGDERAVAAAQAALGDDGLVEVLPAVQSAGISPELRSRVRHARLSLKKLRRTAAERAGADVPGMEKLHRISLGQVVMTAVTVFAVYAVITALADIGLDTIVDAISGASWGLVLVALVLTQLTNVGAAYSVLGASPKPLPLGVVTIEQFAVGFINLAVPSTAARMAMNMRFAQRLGLAPTSAVTLGGLTGLAGFAVQLVLLFLLIVPGDNSVDWSSLQFSGTVFKLLVLALVVGVGAMAVVAIVPKWRAKALDRVREPLQQMREGIALLRSPRQSLMLFGGNLMSQLLFAAALGLCLRAVGGSVGFAELVFINTVVSLFAGMAPVPGGIGVTEAGLISGLTAVGVSQETAVAAVILYRMCSYYLPPLWGWFALRWLTDNDYL